MMITVVRITFFLLTAATFSLKGYSQVMSKSLKKSNTMEEEITNAVFIDKFLVPKLSIEEFKKQMHRNREFIQALSGYVSGEAFEQYDTEGNLTILTIAVWKNPEKLNEAKLAVQAEFKRVGFNPMVFYQQLNIKMERGQYAYLKE